MSAARDADREIANSRRASDIKTSRTRQAHWIKFCIVMEIDPCLQKPYLLSVLVSYTKLLINGMNLRNKEQLRSATVQEYIADINELFTLRNLQIPVPDFDDKTNPVATLIKNLRTEESIANQRAPLTPEIVAEAMRLAEKASRDSLEALMFDIIIVSREVGPRAGEITQKKNEPDYFCYPSGKRVIKAMCRDWWTAYDASGNVIDNWTRDDHKIESMKICWKIQKNRRNNEPLKYKRDGSNKTFCVTRAVTSIAARAERLGQPQDLPLAVYKQKDKTLYLTARKLTAYLRMLTKKAHPTWSDDMVSKISAHSFRVWACMLLHEAGKDGDYIKRRLRWLSDAYRGYLRDSPNMASKHNSTLQKNSELIESIRLNPQNLPEMQDDDFQIDEEMGEYDESD